MGILLPNDLQKTIIPELLSGKNTIFTAPTGSGKTLTYLLPVLSRLLTEPPAQTSNIHSPSPRLLIVLPSTDLGIQLLTTLRTLTSGLNLKSTLLPFPSSIPASRLHNPDIGICTPFAIKELIKQEAKGAKGINRLFERTHYVVFDEMDLVLPKSKSMGVAILQRAYGTSIRRGNHAVTQSQQQQGDMSQLRLPPMTQFIFTGATLFASNWDITSRRSGKKNSKVDPTVIIQRVLHEDVNIHKSVGVHFTPKELSERFITIDVDKDSEPAPDVDVPADPDMTPEQRRVAYFEAHAKRKQYMGRMADREAELKCSALLALVNEKLNTLAGLEECKGGKDEKWLVFVNSERRIEQIVAALDGYKRLISRKRHHLFGMVELRWDVAGGEIGTTERSQALFGFAKAGRVKDSGAVAGEEVPRLHLLLATDYASRGIDFMDVDCVVQVDMATDQPTYLHRCGRTARAGRHGEAISFVVPKEEKLMKKVRDRDRMVGFVEGGPVDGGNNDVEEDDECEGESDSLSESDGDGDDDSDTDSDSGSDGSDSDRDRKNNSGRDRARQAEDELVALGRRSQRKRYDDDFLERD